MILTNNFYRSHIRSYLVITHNDMSKLDYLLLIYPVEGLHIVAGNKKIGNCKHIKTAQFKAESFRQIEIF